MLPPLLCALCPLLRGTVFMEPLGMLCDNDDSLEEWHITWSKGPTLGMYEGRQVRQRLFRCSPSD